MKPSRQAIKNHRKAEGLLTIPDIHNRPDDIEFILANWNPGIDAPGVASDKQVYFTPRSVAGSTMCQMSPESHRRTVDICAGIGALTFAMIRWMGWHDRERYDLTAIELNPRYVEIGRKLMPYVNWVQADVLDRDTWRALGRFDDAVSNPPFGVVYKEKVDTDWIGYSGPMGLTIAAVGVQVSECGVTAILNQSDTPYRYSGRAWDGEPAMAREVPEKWQELMDAYPGMESWVWAEDMSQYRNEWYGAKPKIEVVNISSIEDLWPFGEALLV